MVYFGEFKVCATDFFLFFRSLMRPLQCAIGTATGDEQIHVLEGVRHPHNILFDPTVVLMAHLFLRDAFAKKYEVRTTNLDLLPPDQVQSKEHRRSLQGQ